MLTAPRVQPGVGKVLTERLLHLRGMRRPVIGNFTARVRELVLLASSSRGGSSMVAELLRRSPALVHLRAEFNPFLRLADLSFPASRTGSDHLDAGHLARLTVDQRRVFDEDLALDAGHPSTRIDDERFILDVAWRFVIQWPTLDFDLSDWIATAHRVLERTRRDHGWGAGLLPDAQRFHAALFTALRERDIPVRTAYYDIPDPPSGWPRPDEARGAPGEVLLEEPPFVLSQGWRHAREDELATKPLVIKTPSNAYRLGFLRALFPNARIRMIHLTRNPGASINGLYDGWLHHGFHAHRTARPLNIQGYAVDRPHDRWWWKFDLPPGWESYTDASLPQVCAMQWRSCHRAILDDLAVGDIPHLRLPFEDFIDGPERRTRAVRRLSDWLGIPFDARLRHAADHGLGAVAATAPPAPGRWRRRLETIRATIGDVELRLARELGYTDEDTWL